ncbi:MAG: PH domain-containing protein [Ruminococcaceae bacterium]|nr:PH domain-containing protein [Oscillospiraceae bacterium]
MKKHWGAFWITETVVLTGTAAAVIALIGLYLPLSVLAGVCGGIGAAAYWLHFRSLKYSLENGRIVIRKGISVRSQREIPVESILMAQSAELFGRTLYTSLSTAGGRAVLFCKVDLPDIRGKAC